VHGTPITKEDNLLDRFSTSERFDYFARVLHEREMSLVQERVRTVVPRGRVLNVGCGRHGTERGLFPADAYEIYGVDVNEESLRILGTAGTYEGVLGGSITQLPFPAASFEVLYLRLVLHHLISPRNLLAEGLEECFRVLRPGGVLAFVEPNSWHPVGAMMNLAHAVGMDMYVHGTDDDVALSPRMLRKRLSRHSSAVSTHTLTYAWRRMPVTVQAFLGRVHARARALDERVPFFGHTLMMVAVKD
jgi:SAM-dependent methyltransferase